MSTEPDDPKATKCDKKFTLYGKTLTVYMLVPTNGALGAKSLNEDKYEKYVKLANVSKFAKNINEAEQYCKDQAKVIDSIKRNTTGVYTPIEIDVQRSLAASCTDGEMKRVPDCLAAMKEFEQFLKIARRAIEGHLTLDFGIDPIVEKEIFKKGIAELVTIVKRWMKFIETYQSIPCILSIFITICEEKISFLIDSIHDLPEREKNVIKNARKNPDLTEEQERRLITQIRLGLQGERITFLEDIKRVRYLKGCYGLFKLLPSMRSHLHEYKAEFQNPATKLKKLAEIYSEVQIEMVPTMVSQMIELIACDQPIKFTQTAHVKRMNEILNTFDKCMLKWSALFQRNWEEGRQLEHSQEFNADLLGLSTNKYSEYKNEFTSKGKMQKLEEPKQPEEKLDEEQPMTIDSQEDSTMPSDLLKADEDEYHMDLSRITSVIQKNADSPTRPESTFSEADSIDQQRETIVTYSASCVSTGSNRGDASDGSDDEVESMCSSQQDLTSLRGSISMSQPDLSNPLCVSKTMYMSHANLALCTVHVDLSSTLRRDHSSPLEPDFSYSFGHTTSNEFTNKLSEDGMDVFLDFIDIMNEKVELLEKRLAELLVRKALAELECSKDQEKRSHLILHTLNWSSELDFVKAKMGVAHTIMKKCEAINAKSAKYKSKKRTKDKIASLVGRK